MSEKSGPKALLAMKIVDSVITEKDKAASIDLVLGML